METKNNNVRKWWLYGALVSFVIAVVGVILVLFVFKDKKSHKAYDDEDDEDDTEVVEKRHHAWDDDEWDDEDDEDDMEERKSKNSLDDLDDIRDIPDEEVITPEEPDDTDDSIYDVVEQQPQFSEGDISVWLSQNIQYPPEAMADGIHGRVLCQFIVEKDGTISNVTVLRSVDPLLDKEAVRVLESMPNWKPGMKDGQPVRVKYTVPISFNL